MNQNRQKLLDYLRSQNLMSVATHNKKLWICSVYYVIDSDFNLYFLSEPATEHCQDIIINGEVACAIADSKQKAASKKIGVQLNGITTQIINIQKIKWMLALWNKINPGFESIINLKNIKNKVIKSKIYKIVPKVIKFFNEQLYGPEGFEVFNF
ncbi:MAG: hypothetical protein WC557_01450 [Ignavibacteriaceae bacterium]